MDTKKMSLAVAAAAGLTIAQASWAADLPRKAPVYAPPPVIFNWSGFYIGGNLGYGWGVSSGPDVTFADPVGTVGFGPYFAAGGNVTPDVKPHGIIGGGQIGYNWMFAPGWVAGVVADFQGSGMKDSATNISPPSLPVATSQSNEVRIDWFGTVRGKVGYAMNNWLLYATGGLAYGHVKTSGSFNTVVPGPVAFSGSNDETRAGWTVGAGLDYGITRNWVVGVEYLYVDLGRTSYTETATFAPFQGASLTVDNRAAAHIVRASLNYKF